MAGALAGAVSVLRPRPRLPLDVAIVPTQPSPASSPVTVHVVGAVERPGIYQLPTGARVEDVIGLAGGMRVEADAASVNLAARLSDGQQVNVRPRQASPEPRAAPSIDPLRSAGRININSASAADLDSLPGIGPALSRRIIERRQSQGPFNVIDDLVTERLIPASTFERLKQLISAE